MAGLQIIIDSLGNVARISAGTIQDNISVSYLGKVLLQSEIPDYNDYVDLANVQNINSTKNFSDLRIYSTVTNRYTALKKDSSESSSYTIYTPDSNGTLMINSKLVNYYQHNVHFGGSTATIVFSFLSTRSTPYSTISAILSFMYSDNRYNNATLAMSGLYNNHGAIISGWVASTTQIGITYMNTLTTSQTAILNYSNLELVRDQVIAIYDNS